MNANYLLLLIMPVLVTTGQVILKSHVHSIITGRGPFQFIKSCINPGIIAASVCLTAAPIPYITALQDVKLSEAFAFNSLNYILVFVTGRLILREKVNFYQIIGVILIASGFLLPFIIEAARV